MELQTTTCFELHIQYIFFLSENFVGVQFVDDNCIVNNCKDCIIWLSSVIAM